jgi:hypothetical protein
MAITSVAVGGVGVALTQLGVIEDLACPLVYAEARTPAGFELRPFLLESRDGARWSGDAIGVARIHAMLSREAFSRASAVHEAWMTHRHAETGLFRHSHDRAVWTYRDAGADLFGHLLNAALMMDSPHVEALLDTMERERAIAGMSGLCLDADWRTGNQVAWQDHRSRMFGSAEYVKDGLLPVFESQGHDDVLSRILEVCDAIIEHSGHDSPYGVIPDPRSEVNGEMLQVLGRMYYATGHERYAEKAARIADASIFEMLANNNGLPVKEYDFESGRTKRGFVQLRDHGNELLVGLSETYAMAVDRSAEEKWQERADRWAEPLARMFELILEHGRNGDGLIVNQIDAESLSPRDAGASDNWGYVLCGAELFAQAADLHGVIDSARIARLRGEIVSVVNAVLRTDGLAWEGAHFDGYADSIESALYAAAYFTGIDAEALKDWTDRQIVAMYHKQRSDGFVSEHYLDGNFIRTCLLYGHMRSGGWMADPWSADVGVGYEPLGNGGACVVVQAGAEGWSGRLVPDTSRHQTIVNLPWDWPRINSWPEWCPASRVESVRVLRGEAWVRIPEAKGVVDGVGVDLPPHSMVAIEVRWAAP